MLERATAYIEPGANLLLRRLENPTRSKRVLQPSFWRHGVGNESTPLWWPAYLQDIREIKFTQPPLRYLPAVVPGGSGDEPDTCGHTVLLGTPQRQRGNVSNSAPRSAHAIGRGKRSFSVSHGELAGSSEEPDGRDGTKAEESLHSEFRQEEMSVADEYDESEQSSRRPIAYTGGPVNIPLDNQSGAPDPPSALESLHTLLKSGDLNESNQVWRLFICLSDPAEVAGVVLKYLATSHRSIDLDHAIRAYKLMSAYHTDRSHFQAAITAACRRKQKQLALKIHSEAMGRGFYTETSNILLAFLIRNSLWKSAANVWSCLPYRAKNAGNFSYHAIWSQSNQYTELPERLLQLMEQLEQNSVIYAGLKDQLYPFCKQLLSRVFLNPQIMAQITALGILALLHRFFHAELLRIGHYYAGIRTLSKIASSRNRHPLATLLYRNMDMRFPSVRLPPSVLGSLIVTLCGSDGDYLASRVVLRRFTHDWGKPDKKAYQKVLSACAENGDPEQLQEVFDEYCKDHGPPTSLAFVTPFLYLHARTGNVQEIRKQFDRLESQLSLRPNTYCWNIVITAHARARDHEGAFAEFRRMRQAGLNPDKFTFGILMAVCARSGDSEGVHELVEVAKQYKIPGTTAMIDSLVHSYCLNDKAEDAENLAETARGMRLEGSPTQMWNILLRHHAFRADTDAVLRTQERMQELDVPADNMTYAALMQSLVNIGKTADAAHILRALHLSNSATATMFHYSIILYGYASEDNHDMVAVIYSEMQERFPRISLSARVSRLRSYFHKDRVTSRLHLVQALQGKPMSRSLRLIRTLDYLSEILLEVDQSDLAQKSPELSLSGRTGSEAYPSIYFEFLVSAVARDGAFADAEALLNKYQTVASVFGNGGAAAAPSIQMLSAVMAGLVRQGRFSIIDKYWTKVVSLAVERGRKRALDLSDPNSDEPAGAPKPVGSISLRPFAGASQDTPSDSPVNQGTVKILPAHRYSLAAPLTQYMYSLADQNLAAEILPLISRLEGMGFSLTSKNWNHLLQIFAYQKDAVLQILAFRIFEQKFLPNLPPWDLLRRGKWREPTSADGRGNAALREPVRRTIVERFQPQTPVPTYWTMVFLGLALMKAQYRTHKGEKSGLPLLRSQAPRTVEAVSNMPYLKEKAQGLLLRGSDLRGDLEERPRRPVKADRAGLLGSRSPLDHIPLQYFEDESLFPRRDKLSHDEKAPLEKESPLKIAEQVSGEILRRPFVLEAAGRYEHKREFSLRLRREGKEKLRLAEQLHKDAERSRVMVDDRFGDPYYEAELRDCQQTASTSAAESQFQNQQKLLDMVLDRSVPTMHPRRPFSASKAVPDVPPAAALSAALRPKIAATLYFKRRGKKIPRALHQKMQLFQHELSKKILRALTTYQPPRRIPNRILRGFTKRRAVQMSIKRRRLANRSM